MARKSDDGLGSPYLRLWVKDIVNSCHMMKPGAFGAHIRMMLHAWDNGCCPSSADDLRDIVGNVTDAELAQAVGRWKVSITDAGEEVLVNSRLEEERQIMIAQAEARSRAAVHANNVRWDHIRNGSESDPNRIRHGSQTDPTTDNRQQTTDIASSNSNDSNTSSSSNRRSSARAARPERSVQDPLSWNPSDGWVGITDADKATWSQAFPDVDLDIALSGLNLWLLQNKAKSRKKFWRRWLEAKLLYKQERGGNRGGGSGGNSGGLKRTRVHIAADAHPDYEHEWFMPNGFTPRYPLFYHDVTGREKENGGGYIDETPSQGDPNENDE